MSECKKPTATFYGCVALAGVFIVLVVYPLSEGPVWWLCFKLGQPEWLLTTIDYIYGPWNWVLVRGPEWIQRSWPIYFDWWLPAPPPPAPIPFTKKVMMPL